MNLTSIVESLDPDTARQIIWRIDPAAWAEDIHGLDLDDWQRAFVRDRRKRICAVTSRQVGKSLCVGLRAAHRAAYRPNSTVVMVAASERQSAEVFRYLRRLLVVGATSVTRRAPTTETRTGVWVGSLLERKPTRLVTVAIANKTARTARALLVKGECCMATPAVLMTGEMAALQEHRKEMRGQR